MLTDFNCKILSTDNKRFSPSDSLISLSSNDTLIDDIELLGSLGFHRLVCQIFFDQDKDILYYVKRKSKSLEQSFKKLTSRKLSGKYSFHCVIVTYLTEDTPFLKDLHSLVLKGTNYIFLELPWGSFPDRLHITINKLLYTKNLLPAFTNFHIYTSVYAPDTIQKLINIKGAAFQFPLNFTILSQNIDHIKTIVKNGGVILLGSSSDHFNLNIGEIAKCLEWLQKRLGTVEYTSMIIRARALLK